MVTFLLVAAAILLMVLVDVLNPVVRRQQIELEEERLRRLEEELGKDHPEVRALKVKHWRHRLYGNGEATP
ncbi:MAG TPA: hypothetical protein VK008_03210 [Sphingobacteriaceae bacterium]|nr:hypothetical protein [Sphingobacteriaceae bacterium]